MCGVLIFCYDVFMVSSPQASTRSFDYGATQRLWAACRSGDLVKAKRALTEGGDPNAKGTKGLAGRDTLLGEMAALGNPAVIQLLLTAGARQVGGRENKTPLFRLCEQFDVLPPSQALETLALLLKKGNPLIARKMAVHDVSPLQVLLEKSSPSDTLSQAVARLLVATKKKSWPEELASGVLATAFRYQPPATFVLLVEAGLPVSSLKHALVPLPVCLLDKVSTQKYGSDEEWWDAFSRLPVPCGLSPSGIRAQARLDTLRASRREEALGAGLPEPTLVKAPRLRF